ncbi:MAG: DUF3820 family protein [Bacteroidia bacterium]
MQELPLPNPKILKDLFTTKMPFGKYQGRLIADLPTYYLEWFSSKGFPKGKIGMLLSTLFEIRTNGLSQLLVPIREMVKKENRHMP